MIPLKRCYSLPQIFKTLFRHAFERTTEKGERKGEVIGEHLRRLSNARKSREQHLTYRRRFPANFNDNWRRESSGESFRGKYLNNARPRIVVGLQNRRQSKFIVYAIGLYVRARSNYPASRAATPFERHVVNLARPSLKESASVTTRMESYETTDLGNSSRGKGNVSKMEIRRDVAAIWSANFVLVVSRDTRQPGQRSNDSSQGRRIVSN